MRTCLLLLSVFTMACNQQPDRIPGAPKPDRYSQDFATRFVNFKGDSLRLHDGSSRATLIHIGAASCALCLSTLPILYTLRDAVSDSALRTVVVFMDGTANRPVVERAIAEVNDRADVLLDPEQRVRTIASFLGEPAFLVLDRNGKLMETFVGSAPGLGGRVELAVQTAIKN